MAKEKNSKGLRQDLIDAKIEALVASGANRDTIDQSKTSGLYIQADLEKEAFLNFLTSVDFTITKLKAPVIIENLKTDDQSVDVELKTLLGDKAPIIDTIKKIPGIGSLADPLESSIKRVIKPLLKGGSTLPGLNLNKNDGTINSTGYVFVGEDPDSQNEFDVSAENGQIDHTAVKLLKDNIPKELL